MLGLLIEKLFVGSIILYKVIRPTSNRIKALSEDVDVGLIDFEEIEF